MNKNNVISFLLALIFLAGAVFIAGKNGKSYTTDSSNGTATSSQAKIYMKGVWVSYMTLDMQNGDKDENAFTDKIKTIVSTAKSSGFNTLVFQVRPFCDALYKSDYYPWSHILTGTQGENPGYDPLEIMCEICHKNNMYIHAWLNPYRVATKSTPPQLSDNNPYNEDETIGFEYNDCKYLSPSNENARKLIVNGVSEIVSKYDVDGIQFDDYFYPDGYDGDKKEYDEYKSVNNNNITIDKWRMQNVNQMISEVYKAVHKYSSKAMFGISPQGNLSNNASLFADVKTWYENIGYADYICPQIYFSLDNPALSFEDALNDWMALKRHSGLKVYIGLAGYKGGTDADSGTWLDNSDILKNEAKITKSKGLDGVMLYSYDSLISDENQDEINNLVRYIKQ